MSIEELKGRIELAHGFRVSAQPAPPPAEPERPQGLLCPHCGGKLRWCSVVVPRPLGSRALWRVTAAKPEPPAMNAVSPSG